MTELRAALFLDRDGVCNEDTGYAHGNMNIYPVPGIVNIFQYLQNFPIFVPAIVTNQSGIARGIYDHEDFWTYTKRLETYIRKKSGYKGEILVAYAPFYNTESEEIKPKPGMLLRLAEENHLVLRESYIIGDNLSDLLAGAKAGLRGYIHRFQGSNVYDLFKCIPEVKFAMGTRERQDTAQRRTLH
tara:strand:- start:1380 stop:1937 length:558 start_codon:yes stop_codon:yes gene_type:complete